MLATQIEVSDGTLNIINVGIEFFEQDDISVSLDQSEIPLVEGVGYIWSAATTIQFLNTVNTPGGLVPNGVEVILRRDTKTDAVYNVYDGGAPFSRLTLDENFEQLLRLAQEYSEGLGLDGLRNNLSMNGYRVTNLGSPVVGGDATNKGYVDAGDATAQAYADVKDAVVVAYVDAQNNLQDGVIADIQTDLTETVRGVPGEILAPLPPASSRANKVMGFDASGNPVGVLPLSGSGTELALDLANTVDVGKGSWMVANPTGIAGGVTISVGAKLATLAKHWKEFGIIGDGSVYEDAALQAAWNARGVIDFTGAKIKVLGPTTIPPSVGWGVMGTDAEIFSDVYTGSLVRMGGTYVDTHKQCFWHGVKLSTSAAGGDTPQGLLQCNGPNVDGFVVASATFSAPNRGINGIFMNCRNSGVDQTTLKNILFLDLDLLDLGRMGIEITNHNDVVNYRYKNVVTEKSRFKNIGSVGNGMGVSYSGIGESSFINDNEFEDCAIAHMEFAGAGRNGGAINNRHKGVGAPLQCSQATMTNMKFLDNETIGECTGRVLLGSLTESEISRNLWRITSLVTFAGGSSNIFEHNRVFSRATRVLEFDNSSGNTGRFNVLSNAGYSNASVLRCVNAGSVGNLLERNTLFAGTGGSLFDEALSASGNFFDDNRSSLVARPTQQVVTKRGATSSATTFTITFGTSGDRRPHLVELFASVVAGGGGSAGATQITYHVSAYAGGNASAIAKTVLLAETNFTVTETYGVLSMTITLTPVSTQNLAATLKVCSLSNTIVS